MANKMNEKEVFKRFNYFNNAPLGDVVYHHVSDKWGDIEEVVVESLPQKIRVYHRVKEGEIDENKAMLVFDRNNDSKDPETRTCSFNKNESHGKDKNGKSMNYDNLAHYLIQTRYYLHNHHRVKPFPRPYEGWSFEI